MGRHTFQLPSLQICKSLALHLLMPGHLYEWSLRTDAYRPTVLKLQAGHLWRPAAAPLGFLGSRDLVQGHFNMESTKGHTIQNAYAVTTVAASAGLLLGLLLGGPTTKGDDVCLRDPNDAKISARTGPGSAPLKAGGVPFFERRKPQA